MRDCYFAIQVHYFSHGPSRDATKATCIPQRLLFFFGKNYYSIDCIFGSSLADCIFGSSPTRVDEEIGFFLFFVLFFIAGGRYPRVVAAATRGRRGLCDGRSVVAGETPLRGYYRGLAR